MTSYNVSSKEFGRRFRKALSIPFSLKHVCSTNVQEFVTSFADSLGCTEKEFFFPLLTCAAACMGTESYIEIINHWKEPPIVWTLVVTPKSLLRVDVAEYLKQLVFKAQTQAYVLNHTEDSKDYLKKFLFDMFTLEQLQEMLKLSNGHGLAIYNSARSLHKHMIQPEEADVMLRLHSGLAWFQDSRVRSAITKTRFNFAIVSTPATVHQTLTSAPNFQELFHQCFLTTCSEDSHVKFAQFSEKDDSDKLVEIFSSLLKLHSSHGPIVYKLSAEAKEKFSQIHDELTDKAKQMVRKNAHKVFQPALSYLGRLTCILHVLDNIIDAINYQLPVSHLTWNTEISENTVWQARELLGHIVEQRHALMEQTMIETQQKPQAPIEIVDGQTANSVPNSPHSLLTPPAAQRTSPYQSSMMKSSFSVNNARRNLMNTRQNFVNRGNFMNNNRGNFTNNNRGNFVNNNRGNFTNTNRGNFTNNRGNFINNRGIPNVPVQPIQVNNPPVIEPIIASVHSAGLPVANQNTSFNPIISSCETVSNASNGNILSPTLSISRSEETEPVVPILLSRAPALSILEISEQDFIRTQKGALKKLLKHTTGEITPSRCVQLKLTPDLTASEENLKYTPAFSRLFLKRLESLGFGICDGANNGNKRHFVFKKKKFSALGDEQKQILTELNISEVEYNKCFTTVTPENSQNGSVVCLE